MRFCNLLAFWCQNLPTEKAGCFRSKEGSKYHTLNAGLAKKVEFFGQIDRLELVKLNFYYSVSGLKRFK
jgi:hypothetical protein